MAKKKKKKSKKSVFKIFLTVIISLFLISIIAFSGIALAMIKTAPKLDVQKVLNLNEPSVLYDDKNQVVDKLLNTEQRISVTSKTIPDQLEHAFVSIEDERFYKHHGIDPLRIFGALASNVVNKLKHTPKMQGASTITQQLVKNTLLTPEQSIKRKIQEMYLSLKLEKELPKDKILESYMNTIFLGGNAFGVEAASNQYFNKNVKDLNLIECAFLAGIPQSPSIFYPFSPAARKNPSIYINRTKLVLAKMQENNYISQIEYSNAISSLNNKKLVFTKPKPIKSKLNYEWFTIPVIEQVKNDLKDKYKYSDKQVENMLSNGGFKIYTTMNKTMQDTTQKIIDNSPYIPSYTKNNIIQTQASTVVMDYHTGDVKVIVGGRGNQPPRSYNRAASNNFLRPAGSSIKPITVYAPAIDTKKATAGTGFEDSPVPSSIGKKYSSGAPYNPKNSPNIYYGYVNMREALKHSINVVAVKIEDLIGLKTGISYAEKFGITLDSHDKTSMASLALGQLHRGVNPLIMAQAYGALGNNGTYTHARLYTKVVDRQGNVVLENKLTTKKVLSPQAAFITYDMLQGPVSSEGTGPEANFGNMEVRGKTGTSSDARDLWFCGLTPYYSGAVWIGSDNSSPVRGVYSKTAAKLWGDIMREIHANLPNKQLSRPKGIVMADVDSVSGKLPSSLSYEDPRGSTVYSEYFIDGTIPKDYDDIHVAVRINKLTGKLASSYTPNFLTETKVFLKRDYYPSVELQDQKWVLPSESDTGKGYSIDENKAKNQPKNKKESQNNKSAKDDVDSKLNKNENLNKDKEDINEEKPNQNNKENSNDENNEQ